MYCSQGGREDEDDPSIVGKENWEGYEAGEFNIWRRSKWASMATENR